MHPDHDSTEVSLVTDDLVVAEINERKSVTEGKYCCFYTFSFYDSIMFIFVISTTIIHIAN